MLHTVLGRVGVFPCREDPTGETFEVVDLGSVFDDVVDIGRIEEPLFVGSWVESHSAYLNWILIMEWAYRKGYEAGSDSANSWHEYFSEKAKSN